MSRDWYPDLIKVFYVNLRVENGIICSRVKGVNIKLDEGIWSTIVGFKLGGYKSQLGMLGINRLAIYKACLRNPYEPRDFTLSKSWGTKRDGRLCAFVISWILLPRGGNNAQLTTEDVYLLHDLMGRLKTFWTTTICDHMVKISKQNMASLPYVVFLSRVMLHHFVNLTNEVTMSYNKTNLISNLALCQMGLRKSKIGWTFKDEQIPTVEEDVVPLKVDKSIVESAFQPKTNFERFVGANRKVYRVAQVI